MNLLPKALSNLIESFERLPGIGPKTAQRLSYYLLHVPQLELEKFSENIRNLKKNTLLCSICKNVSETDPCRICQSPARQNDLICVVEQPTDVLAVEKTGKFQGVYHVLHGAIDPLNNIGPDEIYINELMKRISDSANLQNIEIILATNSNMEGEATAMYIQKQISMQQFNHVTITRLAHGIPIGSDIEYADEVTLTRALEGRRKF